MLTARRVLGIGWSTYHIGQRNRAETSICHGKPLRRQTSVIEKGQANGAPLICILVICIHRGV
ncbi:hypothetical protein DPMN_076273 [Dreissena polymorpha]|uniref:Uncharacterized protein n=1 Tax=Dreissena polymorpha TaxID=45954 RepID=A0A9D3YL72_DREPO|nr:hypothetical protein DPMN_076273 [Dreissena polymorpha]